LGLVKEVGISQFVELIITICRVSNNIIFSVEEYVKKEEKKIDTKTKNKNKKNIEIKKLIDHNHNLNCCALSLLIFYWWGVLLFPFFCWSYP